MSLYVGAIIIIIRITVISIMSVVVIIVVIIMVRRGIVFCFVVRVVAMLRHAMLCYVMSWHVRLSWQVA